MAVYSLIWVPCLLQLTSAIKKMDVYRLTFYTQSLVDRWHGSQVLKGSHQAGRIEHVPVGEQSGADLERVDELKEVWNDSIEFNTTMCTTGIAASSC